MRQLQILMEFAKNSDSEVIKRANGSHSLTSSQWVNLKKVIKNQIKHN